MSKLEIVIRTAKSAADLTEAKTLFREYVEDHGLDLGFQGFDAELKHFPGPYGPPDGVILLADLGGETVGVIALKRLEADVCEMKRLFVRHEGRGRQLGRLLSLELMSQAKNMGYLVMKLDTLARLTHAKALYEGLGFTPTEPYNENPFPDILYYQRKL